MLRIQEDINAMKAHVVALRRQLHQIPEPGLQEYETTHFILNYLKGINIDAEITTNGTGVVGFLKGEDSSRTIAFRADIDALSVEEQTDVEYCSKKAGFMHACGHDGHMAILLGFANYMAVRGTRLPTNILFIFQPAEEGPGGALPLIEGGLFQKYPAESIFGLHIYPEIAEGKIGCRPGPMMAQTGEFDIRLIGQGAHGAMPHKGVDALVAASHVVSALQTIVSRNINPLEPAVLTIGRLVSGERRNIIAHEALLEGTMRAFKDEVYAEVRGRLIKVAEDIADAFHCKAEIEIRDMYPAVVNDEKLFESLTKTLDKETLEILPPLMISEDFSYYQKSIPGLFIMLGSRNEGIGLIHPLHSNQFNFNEDILISGIQVFLNLYNQRVEGAQ